MSSTVLVVDDDPNLVRLMSKFLKLEGFAPVTAGNGLEALQYLRGGGGARVILLDLRLHDQSGLEVLNRIRAIDARIPVVFVTLSRSADSAIEAMRQGAYDYLLKPLDVQKLGRVIGETLKVARLMREGIVKAHKFIGVGIAVPDAVAIANVRGGIGILAVRGRIGERVAVIKEGHAIDEVTDGAAACESLRAGHGGGTWDAIDRPGIGGKIWEILRFGSIKIPRSHDVRSQPGGADVDP